MKLGDYLTFWLIGNYVLIGAAYAWQKDWDRLLYWFGAVCIVTATVRMK